MSELEIKPSLWSQLRVIVVAVAGMAISGTLIALLAGGGKGFFDRKTPIYTYMPDGTGLAKGSPVLLSGIPIGKVTKVDVTRVLDPQRGLLDPQRAVRVDMSVRVSFLKSIPRDSQTSIGADTLVGYKYVSIAQGKSPLSAQENTTLPSEPMVVSDVRADMVRSLHDELAQVDDLLAQVSSVNTPIGGLVVGDALYGSIQRYVQDFDRTVREMFGPGSPAGLLIFSDGLYTRVREPLTRLDTTLAAVQKGEGPVGRFFADDRQYDSIVRELRVLRAALAEANSGKGPYGEMLGDETRYRAVVRMLASTDALLASLNAGDGKAGRLLADKRLYTSLNASVLQLRALIEKFHADPNKYLHHKVY